MSGNRPYLIALAVVGVLIVAWLGYTFMSGKPAEKAPSTVTTKVEIPEPEPSAENVPKPAAGKLESLPEEEPAEPTEQQTESGFVLPRLDDSDQLVRDGVVSLTRHEGINAWLGTNELVRKAVVFTDNVSNGSVPRSQVAFMAPQGQFIAKQFSEDTYVMDEANYERYNRTTDILVSVDSRRAAEFYVLLRPLFQRAYDELGYPKAKFDDAIFKAIGRLLETPIKTEPVKLVRPVVTYEYQDPKLEALSDAQKQLLRMGPRNTRLIQAKLSEFALELRNVLRENKDS